MMLRRDERHVYVAADGSGRHKIGFSGNVPLRMYHLTRRLQRPVVAVHVEPMMRDAEAVEVFAHWALVDRHDHSEWFNATAEEAIEAVRGARLRVVSGELPTARPIVKQRQDIGVVIEAALGSALRPGETRLDFIREAVEREIKRRSRQKD